MPSLIEAVPGTSFLLPIFFVLISNSKFTKYFPLQNTLAVIALLVFPVGWLALQIESFLLIYVRGRYEKEPVIRYIRKNIIIEKTEKGEYKINFNKVIPDIYPNKIITCDQKEFEELFDPYKILKRIPFSYRRRQETKKEKLPYVENIENMIFFNEKASNYIRELHKYWHITFASALGFINGLIIAFGIYLIFNGFIIYGMAIIYVFIFTILLVGAVNSYLRKREAISNEYLVIRLNIPKYNS